MTEQEWNTSQDPQAMLEFLRRTGNPSERKARLFAVACCRMVWSLLGEPESKQAVFLAEEYADGERQIGELANQYAVVEQLRAAGAAQPRPGNEQARSFALHAVSYSTASTAAYARYDDGASADFDLTYNVRMAADCVARAKAHAGRLGRDFEATNAAESEAIRDIWGSPFRVTTCQTDSWSDGVVNTVARATYQERAMPAGTLDPPRLAVLADALEEGGVSDSELLTHLRSEGPHYRGCWALDCVLVRA